MNRSEKSFSQQVKQLYSVTNVKSCEQLCPN